MIETIERKICDVCKKEVKNFAGSLKLAYSVSDYTGCGIICDYICIDCCRKLHKAIKKALSEVSE